MSGPGIIPATLLVAVVAGLAFIGLVALIAHSDEGGIVDIDPAKWACSAKQYDGTCVQWTRKKPA
jgi:hypothetical protein